MLKSNDVLQRRLEQTDVGVVAPVWAVAGGCLINSAMHSRKGPNHESYHLYRWTCCCRYRRTVICRLGVMKPSSFTGISALRLVAGAAALITVSAMMSHAEQVGNVDVDWLGNDIVIEAFADPEVAGVTCHVAYFERGLMDRLQNGNWFEDPSNASIACRQTGTITIGDIDQSDEGENVFSERRSIIWKSLNVKRILDSANQTLIYISHSREIQNGSAKMSISTVPLFQE